MHQDYDNPSSELISVAELWHEEINKLTHALEYLKVSKDPANQRLRWKYEIIIEYLKQRVKEEMQGLPLKTNSTEKRTLH
jgi:hypothetical protein|tara:strand:+ start:4703 stop:4942 length:240 start_codon:yes stop_codon:yes gene_type:complete